MIVAPSPSLSPIRTAEVAGVIRQGLRAVDTGLVRSRGANRYECPVAVFLAADFDDVAPGEIVESLSGEERSALEGAQSPAPAPKAQPPKPDPEPSADEPVAGESVDPGDRTQFPNVGTLRRYAASKQIDLGGATTRADIETAITAHQSADSEEP